MANQSNKDVAYLPVSFDDLPGELLPFIFRRLALDDLIKCRLVSSTFEPIVFRFLFVYLICCSPLFGFRCPKGSDTIAMK